MQHCLNILKKTIQLSLSSFKASELDKVVFDPQNLQAPEVICFGEALLDRLGPLGGDPSIDKPVEDCFGGAPANVACCLSKLGRKAAFVGRLGSDRIGDSFRDLMKSRGVNLCGLQIDERRPTRVVLVHRDLNGERSFQGFETDKGSNYADQAFQLNALKNEWPFLISNARWLLIGTIPLASSTSAEALLWSVEQSWNNGIPIALDVNWRPTFWHSNCKPDAGPDPNAINSITPVLEKASLLKLAKEEAIWFFQSNDPLIISRSLPQQPDVVVTDGARPVQWLINGFSGQMNALSPPYVVDTTGAGDAFIAGLLFQLSLFAKQKISQENIQEIVSFAAACGALVCGAPGAIEPQPTLDQVRRFLSGI